MRWSFGMLAVLLVACHAVQPPVVAPVPEAVVPRPFDAVWSTVVEGFADARVPIETIEKASGIIATRAFRLTFEQLKAWGNCGMAGGKPILEQVNGNVMRGAADFNVFVRPRGDSTVVRVNVGIQGERMNPLVGNSFTPDVCTSSGAFERMLLARFSAQP